MRLELSFPNSVLSNRAEETKRLESSGSSVMAVTSVMAHYDVGERCGTRRGKPLRPHLGQPGMGRCEALSGMISWSPCCAPCSLRAAALSVVCRLVQGAHGQAPAYGLSAAAAADIYGRRVRIRRLSASARCQHRQTVGVHRLSSSARCPRDPQLSTSAAVRIGRLSAPAAPSGRQQRT